MAIGTKARGRCSCGVRGVVQQECRRGVGVFYRWYCDEHGPRRGHSVGVSHCLPQRNTFAWLFMRMSGI